MHSDLSRFNYRRENKLKVANEHLLCCQCFAKISIVMGTNKNGIFLTWAKHKWLIFTSGGY